MLQRKGSSVQLVSQSFHPFTEQRGDFLNNFQRRGYIAATFRIGTSQLITLVNMHTNAFPSISLRNAWPTPCLHRQKQLAQGFRHATSRDRGAVTSLNRGQEGLIVCGDFNTLPGDDEIPAAEFGLTNAWAQIQPSGPCVTVP